MNANNNSVTTVILAGGLGLRIGGNKGLQLLQGKPLISWVIKRVCDDSTEVIINVNVNQSLYDHFGYRLISDQLQGQQGPLAGIHAALNNSETEYVMCVPCDTPFLPVGLIPKMVAALKSTGCEAVVVVSDGHRQPAIALLGKKVLPGLVSFLNQGKRKVNDWLNTLMLTELKFENTDAFDNINSNEDLLRAEKREKY